MAMVVLRGRGRGGVEKGELKEAKRGKGGGWRKVGWIYSCRAVLSLLLLLCLLLVVLSATRSKDSFPFPRISWYSTRAAARWLQTSKSAFRVEGFEPGIIQPSQPRKHDALPE